MKKPKSILKSKKTQKSEVDGKTHSQFSDIQVKIKCGFPTDFVMEIYLDEYNFKLYRNPIYKRYETKKFYLICV